MCKAIWSNPISKVRNKVWPLVEPAQLKLNQAIQQNSFCIVQRIYISMSGSNSSMKDIEQFDFILPYG